MLVTLDQTVSAEDEDRLLALYRASISSLESVAAGAQAFPDDDFRAQLRNTAVLKVVGRDRDGRPEALSLVTNDLAEVPWVNPAFYARRFPDQYERRAIFYVASVVVQPNSQGAGWATALMTELTRISAEDNGVCAFDCCDATQSVIPDMALRISRAFADVEPHEVDSQRFYAYVVSNFRRDLFENAERELDLRGRDGAREDTGVDIDLVVLEEAERRGVAARNPQAEH